MKKTYIEPTLLIHKVEACQMICNSINSVSGLNGVTMGEGEFTGGASDARRGRFSRWEEDDFEEE